MNGFECLLPYIILDIKDFFQFISLTNSFTQIYFTLKSIVYKKTAILYFLLFSFVSKSLTNCGRRHLKLFTNCHASWDTLYLRFTSLICKDIGVIKSVLVAKTQFLCKPHNDVVGYKLYLLKTESRKHEE